MQVTLDPQAARSRHQSAVASFLVQARAVSATDWERVSDPAGWTPAQIAEHLRLTYVVVGEGIVRGGGLRVRSAWWIRPLLRWRFLAGILEQGRFPRSKAPREIRPGNGPFARDAVLAGLEAASAAVETRLVERWSDPECRVTHHVFGAMSPPEGMRLVTVHTEHHTKQLSRSLA